MHAETICLELNYTFSHQFPSSDIGEFGPTSGLGLCQVQAEPCDQQDAEGEILRRASGFGAGMAGVIRMHS